MDQALLNDKDSIGIQIDGNESSYQLFNSEQVADVDPEVPGKLSDSNESNSAQERFSYRKRIADNLQWMYAAVLLMAVLSRVSVASSLYLVAFLVGVMVEFSSRVVPIVTGVVAVCSVVGNVILQLVQLGSSVDQEALRVFGMHKYSLVAQYVVWIGIDIVVVMGSFVQYKYKFKRVRSLKIRGDTIVGLENGIWCCLLLAGTSTMSFASSIYMIIFVIGILRWTFFSSKVTIQSMIYGRLNAANILHYKVSRVLGCWVAGVLLALNVYQFDGIYDHVKGTDVERYIGFFHAPGDLSNWVDYVFIAANIFMYCLLHEFTVLHKAALEQSEEETEEELENRERSMRALLKMTLRNEPFVVRAFLKERGVLLGSGVAIFWATSYPSILSAPLITVAMMAIISYGFVSISRRFLPVQSLYSLAFLVLEYILNSSLNIAWTNASTWGTQKLDQPFLELTLHATLAVFLCWSNRTELRYRQLVSKIQENYELQSLLESRRTAESERSTTEADELLQRCFVQERNRAKLLVLWIEDAKLTCLQFLDNIVLFTIFAVVLSTNVNLLQSGYLLLGALFVVHPRIRRRRWRVLLLYSIIVTLLIFYWNVFCPQNTDTSTLIGLRCYNSSTKWKALWPTLFSANLCVVLQATIQQIIYVANKKKPNVLANARYKPKFFLSRLIVEFDRLFALYGVIFCYMAYLAVPLQFERTVNRGSTLFGAFQLFMLMIIMGVHLYSLKTDTRGKRSTRSLWGIAFFGQIIILFARYIYQFKSINSKLREISPQNYISLVDIGLISFSNLDGISKLFLHLLPTAVLMLLCALQYRSLGNIIFPYGILVSGRSSLIDKLLRALNIVQEGLWLYSPKMLAIVTAAVASGWISFFGAVYIGILFFYIPKLDWTNMWIVLYWYSSIVLLFQYVLQLSSLDNSSIGLGSWSNWLGVRDQAQSSLWGIALGQIFVVFFCILQRVSQLFEPPIFINSNAAYLTNRNERTSSVDVNFATMLQTKNVNENSPDESDGAYEKTGSVTFNSEVIVHEDDFPLSFSSNSLLSQKAERTEAKDFMATLLEFLASYSRNAAIDIVMVLFIVSAFAHLNLIGILYIVFVGFMMISSREIIIQRWWIFAYVLTGFICWQYFTALWLPPAWSSSKQSTWPWSSLSNAYEYWLSLNYQKPRAMFADLILLFAIYLMRPGNALTRQSGNPQSKAIAYDDNWTPVVDDEFDFTSPANNKGWHVLQHFVIARWILLTLVFVFITGCLQNGLAAGVYLALSIYMLYYVKRVSKADSRTFTGLRYFNWFYLLAVLTYQAPIFEHTEKNCALSTSQGSTTCFSIYSTIGLFKSTISYPGSPSYEFNVPISSIVIFIMVSIQWQIFKCKSYFYVLEQSKRNIASQELRRKLLYSHFIQKRTQQWLHMKQDKGSALHRLKAVVSKLVNKVEELMDVATGLNYSLPPMAPDAPWVTSSTLTSITIAWNPSNSDVHRIRHYRITRQMYPSLTLLGDFSDAIEVTGTTTSVTIDNLRPGTHYQFKVSAVSRMGEGPFSRPSPPSSTTPFELDEVCSAGWMLHKQKNLPRPFWHRFFRDKLLKRYVIFDGRRFTFYKNEQVAHRHRSMRHPKKLKKSFLVRSATNFELSEPYQFNDLSPKLPCFEVTTMHQGGTLEILHTFQSESEMDFDKWVQRLAFEFPFNIVHSSVLEYLEERGYDLPTESDEASTAHDAAQSEMSSETGYDSWMDDSEGIDAFGDKRVWWLPIFCFVYKFQDVVYRDLTQNFEDENDEPTLFDFAEICMNVARSHTSNICVVSFVASFAFQGDLLNMVYVLGMFAYALFENPRPKPKIWRFFLRYSFVVIFVSYAFQLPLFCQELTENFTLYPSVQPFCKDQSTKIVLEQKVQFMVLLGLYKFDGSTNKANSLFQGLAWNFIVVLTILFHRREMRYRGIWRSSKFSDTDDMIQRPVTRSDSNSSIDSLDQATKADFAESLAMYRSQNSKDLPSTSSTKNINLKGSDSDEDNVQNTDDQGNDAAQYTLTQQDSSMQDIPPPSDYIPTKEEDVLQISKASYLEQNGPREKFLSALPSGAKKYYSRLLPREPFNWDKDAHAAVFGSKPGRDYYSMSLIVQMISVVYLILFYRFMGEPPASENSSRSINDSLLSGYMVLAVFFTLSFTIWDRACYIYGSLFSKMILQYTYIFLLHLSVWLLIPMHTKIYFHHRPALVIYYLLQCVYLWLGARQMKYGYKVFKESLLKPRKGGLSRFVKAFYEVYMFIPFAFEMKTFLDFVCTKTSLELPMWLLLEETVIHLFIVKNEMEHRLEDAKYLRGTFRQPMVKKLFTGGLLLFVGLLCLVGPLALFSTANPNVQENGIESARLRFAIKDASTGLTNILYDNRDIGSTETSINLFTEDKFVERISFTSFSENVWPSSPPQRQSLGKQINGTADVQWLVELDMTRNGPEGHQVAKYSISRPISIPERQSLVNILNSDGPASAILEIKELYVPLLGVTATSGAFPQKPFAPRTLFIQRRSQGESSWWVLSSDNANAYNSTVSDTLKVDCDEDIICWVTLSDNIVTGLSDIGIGAYGITAVYLFVLITIGSFAKELFRGALYEVIYSELPNPTDLLELCEGIYLARGENYRGHLKDEVRLYEKLIRVLRSPETMLKLTGPNVIHIPQKQKID